MLAERKTLQDLLALHPEGTEVELDNFHDVDDSHEGGDTFDRVIISVFDEEKKISYTGAVLLESDDVKGFKAHLKTAFTGAKPKAFLHPEVENELPVLTLTK